MISQVESGKSLIEVEASNRVFNSFHKAKYFFTQAADTVKETTQQAKDFLGESADTAAERVAGIAAATKAAIGEDVEQTKESFGQIKSATSEAFQLAIAASISDWLQAHPNILKLFQILDWAIDRPILSLVILLFTIAIAWSLIKSIGRLFEIAWLSILQTPFRLGKFLLQAGFQLIGSFSSVMLKQKTSNQAAELEFSQDSTELIHQNTQQRLLEISARLEVLKQEQNELLQEAIALLNSENIASRLM